MAELKSSVKLDTYDIIQDDHVIRNVPARSGFVSSSSELSKYANEYPGFTAIQYGYKHMWQLKPNGEWESIY